MVQTAESARLTATEKQLKADLKAARHAWGVAQRLWNKGNSSRHEDARLSYIKALKNYSDFLFKIRGAAAAQRLNDWEGVKTKWEKHKLPVQLLGAGALAATGIGAAYVAATYTGAAIGSGIATMGTGIAQWVALNAGNMFYGAIAALVANLGWQYLHNSTFRLAHASEMGRASVDETEARKKGVSFEDFRGTRSGRFVSKQVRSERWAKGIGRMLGIGLGVGTFLEYGHGTGQEIAKLTGTENFVAKLFGFDVMALKASLATKFKFLVDGVVSMIFGKGGLILGIVGEAQANSGVFHSVKPAPVEIGRASGPASADTVVAAAEHGPGPRGGVEYRDITLGGDPVGRTAEAAIQNAQDAARAAVADGRWSQETADAFLKWLSTHQKEYIEAVTTGKSNGTFKVVDLHGNDRNFAWMADGAGNGGYDTQGNVRVPDGTKAVVGTFSFTDASGKVHTVTIKSPVICNNFGMAPGAEVIATPEAAPAPRNIVSDFWGQLMCPDNKQAQYYFGFTLSDLGNFDPAHWEDAARKVFFETIQPAMPSNYGPDYVLVRVDLNHDGVPDKLVKMYVKDSFDVDFRTGEKVPVKAGDVRDWVVHPDKGPAINVSELPPDQRDQFIEANEKKNTIGVDPTASDEEKRLAARNSSHKYGGLQSTPNPVDKLVIGPDGKLVREIPVLADGTRVLTPETHQRLVNDQIRLFIQGVLGRDVPVDFGDSSASDGTGAEGSTFPEGKIINSILSTPAEKIMSMSAQDIAAQFGLTESQAQELLDYVHKVFEGRSNLRPEKGESLLDFLVRSSAKFVQKVR